MFSFTTYGIPGFMGIHEPEDELLAPRGEFKITNAKNCILSAYIHGEAEKIAGYDIPVFIDGEFIADLPEQDCVMKLKGKEFDCVLIQWDTGRNVEMQDGTSRGRSRGLFCLKTDHVSIKYARECTKKKSTDL